MSAWSIDALRSELERIVRMTLPGLTTWRTDYLSGDRVKADLLPFGHVYAPVIEDAEGQYLETAQTVTMRFELIDAPGNRASLEDALERIALEVAREPTLGELATYAYVSPAGSSEVGANEFARVAADFIVERDSLTGVTTYRTHHLDWSIANTPGDKILPTQHYDVKNASRYLFAVDGFETWRIGTALNSWVSATTANFPDDMPLNLGAWKTARLRFYVPTDLRRHLTGTLNLGLYHTVSGLNGGLWGLGAGQIRRGWNDWTIDLDNPGSEFGTGWEFDRDINQILFQMLYVNDGYVHPESEAWHYEAIYSLPEDAR